MVIAAPRSGTAWAANWLTTDRTLCLHDPMWKHHYSELDAISTTKRLGVACTGLALFPDYLINHKARKVILHRPIAEVNASLATMGLEPLGEQWNGALERIPGSHHPWTDLFVPEKAGDIYTFLTQRTFDLGRYTVLKGFNVQMDFEKMRPDPAVTRRLFAELRNIGRQLN